MKKISYGATSFETNSNFSQEKLMTKLDNRENNNHNNFLLKFSLETNNELNRIVNKETNIDEIKDLQIKINKLHDYSKLLVLIRSFERIYSIIYGSQIRILQRLNYSITENIDDLQVYYDTAVKVYPESYKNYAYNDYLKFLSINKLVNYDEETNSLTITDFGQDFLRYITESNLSYEKIY